MKKILFGVDQLCTIAESFKNCRIGLVTNDVARNSLDVKTRVALMNAGFQLVKLFSPEHGLSANAADGAWVPNQTDELTNLPVVSLYGDKLRPTAKEFQDVDAIVFDVPDVGCRFYTYLWTMTYIMEVCATHNKKLILLDRPNPLSGNLAKVEGPLLETKCNSFLGRWSIPIRHSCTLGELATYFTARYIPNLNLQVITVKNWSRNEFPSQGNWNFDPTSPAIKDAETALLYPGMGLLEGINVNEGRGTESDFKVFGAPWINATSLKNNLDALKLLGISFSTTQYMPEWGLYQGEACHGLRLRLTDEDSFRPVALGIEILKQLISKYPRDCKERLYNTNANPKGDGHLDKLLGIPNSFHSIKNNIHIQTQLDNEQWQNVIAPYLLY